MRTEIIKRELIKRNMDRNMPKKISWKNKLVTLLLFAAISPLVLYGFGRIVNFLLVR